MHGMHAMHQASVRCSEIAIAVPHLHHGVPLMCVLEKRSDVTPGAPALPVPAAAVVMAATSMHASSTAAMRVDMVAACTACVP
jgi:hypothetical protein